LRAKNAPLRQLVKVSNEPLRFEGSERLERANEWPVAQALKQTSAERERGEEGQTLLAGQLQCQDEAPAK